MELGPAQACAVKVVVHDLRLFLRVLMARPFLESRIRVPSYGDDARLPLSDSLSLSEELSPFPVPNNLAFPDNSAGAQRFSLFLLGDPPWITGEQAAG